MFVFKRSRDSSEGAIFWNRLAGSMVYDHQIETNECEREHAACGTMAAMQRPLSGKMSIFDFFALVRTSIDGCAGRRSRSDFGSKAWRH